MLKPVFTLLAFLICFGIYAEENDDIADTLDLAETEEDLEFMEQKMVMLRQSCSKAAFACCYRVHDFSQGMSGTR